MVARAIARTPELNIEKRRDFEAFLKWLGRMRRFRACTSMWCTPIDSPDQRDAF